MAEWDCVVIGGGLAGTVVARRLVEADRRVLMLERGRAVSEPPGSHVRNSATHRDHPDDYFAAIDHLFDYIDRDAAPAGLPGAFTTAIDGGLGIAWTNNCPRAVSGVDRPPTLDDEEWRSCYEVAEAYLAVDAHQFDDSRRARFVVDRLGRRLAEQGRAIEALPLAGVRESPDRIRYLGPADILTAAHGIERRRVEVDRVEVIDGRARGVVVGGEVLVADDVVVAAGSVESPALLARSGVRSRALGRYLSYHPVLIGQVVLDAAFDPAGAPDPLPRLGIAPTTQHPWFTQVLRDTNPFVAVGDDSDIASNRLIEIQVFCPVDPDPANAVVGYAFDVPLRPPDEQRRSDIIDDAEELSAEIGRWRQGCEPQWAELGTPHLMGSCRIGTDPATSVVDAAGGVHGTRGLHVVGNSVIPTRLAVSPSLTAAALAVHTADTIRVAPLDDP